MDKNRSLVKEGRIIPVKESHKNFQDFRRFERFFHFADVYDRTFFGFKNRICLMKKI